MVPRSASLLSHLILGISIPLILMVSAGLGINFLIQRLQSAMFEEHSAFDAFDRILALEDDRGRLEFAVATAADEKDWRQHLEALRRGIDEFSKQHVAEPPARFAEFSEMVSSWSSLLVGGDVKRFAERIHADGDAAIKALQELEQAARARCKQSQEHTESMASQARWSVVLTSLVGVLLTLGAAVWVAGSLARPIYQLQEAAGHLDTGVHDPVPPSGPAEIARLIVHFNDMAKSLAEREAALEQKAHALTMANQDLRQMAHLAKERGERHRFVLESAVDGVISIDENNIVESFNPAAEAMFGWSAKEAIGLDFDNLLTEPWRPKLPTFAVRRLADSNKLLGYQGEATGRRKDGSTFPLELGVSERRLDNAAHSILIVQDITERKEGEEALRKANADLQRARDQALAANRAKSAFLANMSHELRTPLNAIIGYSEMLQEDAESMGATEFIGDLQKIFNSGKHLLSLINDILDLSKIEAGKMDLHLETFPIADMIQAVLIGVQPLIRKNGNALEVACPEDIGTMLADQTRLRQILLNLLSNASKFTEKGKIRLSVERTTVDARPWIHFEVADSGIGMSVEQMQKLFEDFTQGDGSTTRKYGGTGLGLSISRRFSRMMGGDITVSSEPKRGSTFRVSVPATVEESTEEAPAGPVDQPSDRRELILVVDDDPTVQDLVTRHLEKEGYEVVCADNGDDALRLARARPPDAITLDVLMPGKDGWDVLAELKADPNLSRIPVIMVSIVTDQNLSFTLGAAEYLTKPIDRQRLSAVLSKYRSRRATDTVLVVEDDEATREVVKRILAQMSCRIVEAENGRAALEVLEQEQPSLVLLDLMMPEMDGFQFLDRIRGSETWRELPVVVLTAIDLTPEDRLRLNGTVRDVLHKGSNPEELTARLRDQLRRIREQAPQLV